MRKFLISIFCVLFCTIVFAQRDSILLVNAQWTVDTIDDGLLLKQVAFTNKEYLNSNQKITVLELQPTSVVKLSFAYNTTREYTSAMAKKHNAVAAVNGSFFDMEYHNPICFLRIKGVNVGENTNKNTPYRKYYQYGTLALDGGKPIILKTDSLRTWENKLQYADVMTAGPLLMLNGVKEEMRKDRTFVTHRHNRTAIGIKSDGTVLLVAIDGRFPLAEGMSLTDLCKTMQWLGCVSILNLDGGGSTTCYVKGRGIVNFPSDNNKYDNKGERKVSNAILLVK